MNNSDLKRLKRQVARLATGVSRYLTLDEFLAAVSALHPTLSEITEGIYCGTEGAFREAIPGTRSALVFCWETVTHGRPRVFTAYIS